MKILKILSLVAAIASVLAFVGSFPVEQSYASRAKLVQRVLKNDQAGLFGDLGEMVGSPQMLIIDDGKAFIGGADDTGLYNVDERYLRDKKIYPLQLQTVQFVAGNVRLASSVAFILGTIGFLALRRKNNG